MFARAKGKTVLNTKVKAIARELVRVNDSIRTLSDSVQDSPDAGAIRRAQEHVADTMKAPQRVPREPGQTHDRPTGDTAVKKMGRRIHDERFSHYLSSSFKPTRSLKRERSIQRNKAVVMSCVVLIILVWSLFRFLW